MTTPSGRARALPLSATVTIGDLSSRLKAQGIDVTDLASGRAAEHTPAYISAEAIASLERSETHQTLSRGSTAFRAAAAQKLRRDNGIDADPDTEILATMGVKQGLTLALMAAADSGAEVLIEDPCFVSYTSLIALAGAVPKRIPLRRENGYRWTEGEIDRAVSARTRAILLNSPHNPTGTVHTREDLDRIAAAAIAHDLVVITDEVYESLTWGGRRHISIATLPGMADRTISVFGLTKTFSMGGWRIGYVHARGPVATAMATVQQHLITCANSFVQAGAVKALAEGPSPDVIAMWQDWERRADWAVDALRQIPGVVCDRSEGGFYAWPDVSAHGTSEDVAQRLLRDGHVAVVPGTAFGPAGEGHVRVTCTRSWDELREGIRRIAEVLA